MLPPVAIVTSVYNRSITSRLREGAIEAYLESGGDRADLADVDVPGAFELPAVCAALADQGVWSGIVALGCVIKGETSHDQHIAQAVSQGLMHITLNSAVPCAFGLLTVDTVEQARARAGGEKGNKGAESMRALLETLGTIQAVSNTDEAGVTHRLSGTIEDKGGPDA